MDLPFLDILYKWNPTICGILCLASLHILSLSICNQILTYGKCLSSHIFAILVHFSQNKQYNVIEWLLLNELEKVEK